MRLITTLEFVEDIVEQHAVKYKLNWLSTKLQNVDNTRNRQTSNNYKLHESYI